MKSSLLSVLVAAAAVFLFGVAAAAAVVDVEVTPGRPPRRTLVSKKTTNPEGSSSQEITSDFAGGGETPGIFDPAECTLDAPQCTDDGHCACPSPLAGMCTPVLNYPDYNCCSKTVTFDPDCCTANKGICVRCGRKGYKHFPSF